MSGGHPAGGLTVPRLTVDHASVPITHGPDDGAARGALKVLLSAVVVSGLVPAVLHLATAGGPGGAYVGQVLVMVLAGLRFSWILGSPVRHLYELVIWVFVYVFLGMAPYVQFRLGVEPETTMNLRPEYEPTATLIVLVGCGAIVLGSHVARNHQPDPDRARTPDPRRTQQLAVFGLVLAVYYIATLGPRNLILPVVDYSTLRHELWTDPAVATFIYGAVTMSLLVAAISLIKLRREESHALPHARLLQWITLATLFLIVNPVSSPRYIFGSMAFAVLAAFGLYGSIGRFRLVAVATLIGMVVIFPAADAFRYDTQTGIGFENPLQELTGPDYDGFAQILNTAQYVDLEGRTGGRQLLGTLLFWVPRSLWPDKPLDTGVMLAEYKEYNFTNISSPLWAEFYIDFGWVGMIIGLFLVGFFARRLDIAAEAELRLRPSPTVLSCVLPFYSMIILRGSLLQSLAYISMAAIFMLLVQWRPGTRRTGDPRPPRG